MTMSVPFLSFSLQRSGSDFPLGPLCPNKYQHGWNVKGEEAAETSELQVTHTQSGAIHPSTVLHLSQVNNRIHLGSVTPADAHARDMVHGCANPTEMQRRIS